MRGPPATNSIPPAPKLFSAGKNGQTTAGLHTHIGGRTIATHDYRELLHGPSAGALERPPWREQPAAGSAGPELHRHAGKKHCWLRAAFGDIPRRGTSVSWPAPTARNGVGRGRFVSQGMKLNRQLRLRGAHLRAREVRTHARRPMGRYSVGFPGHFAISLIGRLPARVCRQFPGGEIVLLASGYFLFPSPQRSSLQRQGCG